MSSARFLMAALLLTSTAWAQKDEPLPYDDERKADDAPRRRVDRVREEDEDAERADTETFSHIDDPNVGFSFEVLSGLMLFDGARGTLDPRFMVGGRFTWELGRVIPDEFLREMFFADLTYSWALTRDGTRAATVDTSQHYLTLAPAIGYPFKTLPLLAYVQAGVGLNLTEETLYVGDTRSSLNSTRFLFQYGVGLRARPAIVASEKLRLSFRIELTRFIRGYMHDMMLGGSLGLTF